MVGVSDSLRGVLIAAAVCPHPPLLVPAIGAGQRGIEAVRTACATALESVRAADPELLVVVGTGPSTVTHDGSAVADFTPWGADLQLRLPGESGPTGEPLPLALSVGVWLVDQSGWATDTLAVAVATAATVEDCQRLGEGLADRADRVAMLVMSDGSARRSTTGPRPFDPQAVDHDGTVVGALAQGEGSGLLALDAALSAAVDAEGLNPLRVLGGAAAETAFDTQVLYDDAPLGVGYYVAVWERHG